MDSENLEGRQALYQGTTTCLIIPFASIRQQLTLAFNHFLANFTAYSVIAIRQMYIYFKLLNIF